MGQESLVLQSTLTSTWVDHWSKPCSVLLSPSLQSSSKTLQMWSYCHLIPRQLGQHGKYHRFTAVWGMDSWLWFSLILSLAEAFTIYCIITTKTVPSNVSVCLWAWQREDNVKGLYLAMGWLKWMWAWWIDSRSLKTDQSGFPPMPNSTLSVTLVLCGAVGPAHLRQTGPCARYQWGGEALLECVPTVYTVREIWSVLYQVTCRQSV